MGNEIEKLYPGSQAMPIAAVAGSFAIVKRGFNRFIVNTGGATSGTFTLQFGTIVSITFDVTDMYSALSVNFGGLVSVTSLGGDDYLFDISAWGGGTTTDPYVGFHVITVTDDSTDTGLVAVRDPIVFPYGTSAADVQTALELDPDIGPGNVAVSKATVSGADVYTITFQGSLANTNIAQLKVSSSLKQDASTIAVSNSQSGAADVPVTPTNAVYTTAVAAVDWIDTLDLGGATSGIFRIEDDNGTGDWISIDFSQSPWLSGIATADLQGAFYGHGGGFAGTTLAGPDGGPWTLTRPDIGHGFIITSNSTNAAPSGPSITITQTGNGGISQVDHCTFSGTATGGAMTYDGNPVTYGQDITAAMGPPTGVSSFSGSPASGLIVTTWAGYGSHTPITVEANTLMIVGQPQIVSISLTDTPTEGTLTVTLDGVTSAEFNWNDSTPAAITGFTGGGSAGAWTYTADVNAANVTKSASEGATPLRKALTAEIVTIQDGGAAAAANVAFHWWSLFGASCDV
jgi:hypothetical protein